MYRRCHGRNLGLQENIVQLCVVLVLSQVVDGHAEQVTRKMAQQRRDTLGGVIDLSAGRKDDNEPVERLQDEMRKLLVGQEGGLPVLLDLVRARLQRHLVVVHEEGDRGLEHCRFVHLPVVDRHHRTQFVDQQIELVPALLLAEVARLSMQGKRL